MYGAGRPFGRCEKRVTELCLIHNMALGQGIWTYCPDFWSMLWHVETAYALCRNLAVSFLLGDLSFNGA